MKFLTRPAVLRRLGQVWSTQPRAPVTGAVSGADVSEARPFEEIPGPKGIYNLPLIGPMFNFKPFSDNEPATIHKFYDRVMDKYGPITRVYLGEWVLFLEEPADFGMIMKSEGKYPRRMDFYINLLYIERTGIAGTLVDRHGEDWHKMRSPLNPLLMRAKSAQHYLPAQNQVADDLVAQLKKPLSPEDLREYFYRYACESISVVAYNKRLGYLDPDIDDHPEKLQLMNAVRAAFDNLNRSLTVHPFILRHLPLKMKKDYFESLNTIYMENKKMYRETMEEIQNTPKEELEKQENNFLLSLMASGKVTEESMTSVATSLFSAGTDSTARNLSLVLYNLARFPDKQQKLFEEIDRVVGPDGPLTEQAMDDMKYLVACVKESFRLLYPTSSGPQRYITQDIVLQGYKIPAGTSVITMMQRAVKNPKYFPDPHSYLPERWLRDEEGKRETPVPLFAFMPFGFGPRQCVGKRFAEQEIYLAVTKILQVFQVSLEEGHREIELVYEPFAGPRDPIRFVFNERKST